jgi:thiol-disulfide isomerase/thioredoxin
MTRVEPGWPGFRGLARACGRLVLFASLVPLAHADELPRYKLKVGQELIYRSIDGPTNSQNVTSDKTVLRKYKQWTLDVVRQNGDGTWRIVFLQKNRSHVTDPDGEKTESELCWDGYLDLASDGRVIENWTIHSLANPTVLFPPLPPDQPSLATSWESKLALEPTRRNLRTAESGSQPNGDDWRFTEDEEKMEDVIYLTSTRREYVFDRKQGLVRRATTHTTEKWLQIVRPAIPVELVSNRQLDGNETKLLSEESDRYFVARQQCDKLLERASHDFAHAQKLLDQARLRLDGLNGQLTTPLFMAILKNKSEDYEDDRRSYLARAERHGKIVDRPSQDWQTTDFDGTPRALRDYRGKVVILDFWFRSCAWCIRAMPQIKALADDFKGQNVAILGINLDEDDDDAEFVIDQMKLNYPTLKNGPLDEGIDAKYDVKSGPTLVLIDTQGIVRRIYDGYSPTLRVDLGEEIRKLLAEKDR